MRAALAHARIVVAAATLAAVIWRLGSGPFVVGVRAVDGRALLAVSAIVFLTTVCSAWRWTVVARGLGVGLSARAAVAAYYQALFLNVILPSGVAGDVHRGVSHGRAVHDVGRAVRVVVWERGAGQAVQAVLTVAVLFALPSPVRPLMPLVAAGLVATAVTVVALGRVRVGSARSRWMRVRGAVAADIREGVLHRSALPAVALTSVIVVLGHAGTFLIAARTVGVTAPVSRLLPLALLALLAMVVPSLAGWGPREGATAWVFASAGLGADRGAAAAVAYGVMVLVASLPGALVLAAGWLRRRSPSPATRHLPVVVGREGAADA